MENIENKTKIIIAIIIVTLIIGTYLLFQTKEETIEEEAPIATTNAKEEEEEEKKIMVHIMGAIKNPGVITLAEGARMIDAVEAAGGFTQEADIDKINLVYVLEDGIKIKIPNAEEEVYISEENGENVIIEEETKGGNKMVNINKAEIEELTQLPGIGEAMAQRIIDYRKENGNFGTIEDLKNVSGIGEAKFENIKQNICVK